MVAEPHRVHLLRLVPAALGHVQVIKGLFPIPSQGQHRPIQGGNVPVQCVARIRHQQPLAALAAFLSRVLPAAEHVLPVVALRVVAAFFAHPRSQLVPHFHQVFVDPVLAELPGSHVQIIHPVLCQQAHAPRLSLVRPHGFVHQPFQPFGLVFPFPIVDAPGLYPHGFRNLRPPLCRSLVAVQQLHFLHCPQPGHDLFQARFTISFPIRRQIGALGFYALGQLMVPELRFHGQLADGNQVGYAARAALACDLGAG